MQPRAVARSGRHRTERALNQAWRGGLPKLYASCPEWLPDFVRASYRLSDCGRSPGEAEIAAHRGLLVCEALAPANFTVLLAYMEPAALCEPGRAGHAPFAQLLRLANARIASPDELAALFRLLRPFTQANGRGARALWMWRAARGTAAELAALRSFGKVAAQRRHHA